MKKPGRVPVLAIILFGVAALTAVSVLANENDEINGGPLQTYSVLGRPTFLASLRTIRLRLSS